MLCTCSVQLNGSADAVRLDTHSLHNGCTTVVCLPHELLYRCDNDCCYSTHVTSDIRTAGEKIDDICQTAVILHLLSCAAMHVPTALMISKNVYAYSITMHAQMQYQIAIDIV